MATSRAKLKTDLRVRPARPGEDPTLGEVGHRAFRVGELEGWSRYFREHGHMRPGDAIVAEVDGEVAGCSALLRLQMNLGGVDLPVGGVAAVSVAPEHRRAGVADRLMVDGLSRMRKRGDLWSMLYAFRLSFYRRFGYGVAEGWEVLRVNPAQFPASPERRRVRRFLRERDEAAVREVYETWRRTPDQNGPIARSDWWWTARVYKRGPEGVVYREPGGRITGYLFYDTSPGPNPPGPTLLCRELAAVTPAAYRGLYGFLESLRDQYAVVQLTLRAGEGPTFVVDHGLADAPPAVAMMDVCSFAGTGAMARLLDVAAGLAAHPAPARNGASGRLGLDLEDPVFADQTGGFDVSFGKKGARVERGTSARDRLAMTPDRLAPIVLGSTSARALQAQGFITGSARAAALLDAAFAGPRLYLGEANFF